MALVNAGISLKLKQLRVLCLGLLGVIVLSIIWFEVVV
jgi:hypothetical protein